MSILQGMPEFENPADEVAEMRRRYEARIAELEERVNHYRADAVKQGKKANEFGRRIVLMRRNAHYMVKVRYELDYDKIDAVFQDIINLADGRSDELDMQVADDGGLEPINPDDRIHGAV